MQLAAKRVTDTDKPLSAIVKIQGKEDVEAADEKFALQGGVNDIGRQCKTALGVGADRERDSGNVLRGEALENVALPSCSVGSPEGSELGALNSLAST